MSEKHTKSNREALEHQADLVRANLMQHLDAIDRRRHEMFDVQRLARKYFKQIALAVAGGLVLGVGSVGLLTYRLATRTRRIEDHRIRAVVGAWLRPELVAKKKEPGIWGMVRKAAFSALSTALLNVAKHVIQEMVAAREEQPIRGLLPAAESEPLSIEGAYQTPMTPALANKIIG